MKIRALDRDGDWTFGRGRSDYLENRQALAQLLVCRIREIINDCFWNTTAGIDWFNLLGGKDPTRLFLALNALILSTPGVVAIESTQFIPLQNREFSISYQILTVYGSVQLGLPTVNDLQGGNNA